MRSGLTISLLAMYVVSVIASTGGLVLCMRSDGSSCLTLVKHACKPGGCDKVDYADLHACGTSHEAEHRLTHRRCCLDVPVSLRYDQEASAAPVAPTVIACIQCPTIAALEPVIAQHTSFEPCGPDKGPPGHIDTIILQI